jgi:hypothetical protein
LKIVAIITEDFSLFYDLVRELKRARVSFVSLSFDDAIPSNVGIVLTTLEEAPRVNFHEKLAVGKGADLQAIINEAKRRMRGVETYGKLIIGIDPGVRPGYAVVSAGAVLYTAQLARPEDVTETTRHVLALYPAREVVVRVGHGDPTNRNRLINAIQGLGLRIEIVDEHRTTKRTEFPDIDAAINIALLSGHTVTGPVPVAPTIGELKNIQRKSRLASEGMVTISTHLADRVAKGQLTLEEAIFLQEGKGKPPPKKAKKRLRKERKAGEDDKDEDEVDEEE